MRKALRELIENTALLVPPDNDFLVLVAPFSFYDASFITAFLHVVSGNAEEGHQLSSRPYGCFLTICLCNKVVIVFHFSTQTRKKPMCKGAKVLSNCFPNLRIAL